MAEALMSRKAGERFETQSAGTHPAVRVNPFAVAALEQIGIRWEDRMPRGIDDVAGGSWDLVITVCDRAKESCPVLPGHPIYAHWGMEDPAEVQGTDLQKLRAFEEARILLARRIDLLLALPIERLERLTAERELRELSERTSPKAGHAPSPPAQPATMRTDPSDVSV
jgi:protein-tyrosine-phosphatase